HPRRDAARPDHQRGPAELSRGTSLDRAGPRGLGERPARESLARRAAIPPPQCRRGPMGCAARHLTGSRPPSPSPRKKDVMAAVDQTRTQSAYGLQWNRFRILRPEEDRATFWNRTRLARADLD